MKNKNKLLTLVSLILISIILSSIVLVSCNKKEDNKKRIMSFTEKMSSTDQKEISTFNGYRFLLDIESKKIVNNKETLIYFSLIPNKKASEVFKKTEGYNKFMQELDEVFKKLDKNGENKILSGLKARIKEFPIYDYILTLSNEVIYFKTTIEDNKISSKIVEFSVSQANLDDLKSAVKDLDDNRIKMIIEKENQNFAFVYERKEAEVIEDVSKVFEVLSKFLNVINKKDGEEINLNEFQPGLSLGLNKNNIKETYSGGKNKIEVQFSKNNKNTGIELEYYHNQKKNSINFEFKAKANDTKLVEIDLVVAA